MTTEEKIAELDKRSDMHYYVYFSSSAITRLSLIISGLVPTIVITVFMLLLQILLSLLYILAIPHLLNFCRGYLKLLDSLM